MSNDSEELINTLRGFTKAYPEDIFTPMDSETRDAIAQQYPGAIDRISAGMGRHCGKFFGQAADHIEALEARIAELEPDAARYVQHLTEEYPAFVSESKKCGLKVMLFPAYKAENDKLYDAAIAKEQQK